MAPLHYKCVLLVDSVIILSFVTVQLPCFICMIVLRLHTLSCNLLTPARCIKVQIVPRKEKHQHIETPLM